MEFHDEQLAKDYLSCVSYFRLKYFWIDMIDEVSDDFKEDNSLSSNHLILVNQLKPRRFHVDLCYDAKRTKL